MLSENLHKQIFKKTNQETFEASNLKLVSEHLEKFGLSSKTASAISEVDFKLPNLYGKNINDHFIHIATKQTQAYYDMAEKLCNSYLPPLPQKWNKSAGWTKYLSDGTCESVSYPDCEGLIFDIETLVLEGQFPTMAVAASTTHW